MKLVLLGLALANGVPLAYAQNGPATATTKMAVAAGTGKLTGTVRDAAGQPIPFATVALLSATTNQPLDGAACDDKGQFLFTHLGAGSYTLHVSFIGYQALDKTGLVFTTAGESLAVSLTLLAAPAQLGEVVVQGQRALVEEKIDRTVYNAEQDHTTQGGDATDVLKRVPLLSVDLEGNVSVRGSSNIRVLINNKPSTIAASSIANALKQIPADQIKTVEVITSPSAKYDAEGAGGIINIITKKDNLAGKTLDVRLSGGLRSASLNLNGGYRVGKMGFSLGGGLNSGYNTPGTYTNTQRTTNPATGEQSLATQSATQNRRQLTGRYTLGWDYDLDSLNSLAVTAQWSVYNFDWQRNRLLTQTYQRDTLQGSSLRDVRQADNSTTLDMGLTYTHRFKQPQHEFSLLTLYSRTTGTNDFTNTLFSTTNEAVTGRLKNDNDSHNQEVTVQADYQRPLGKKQLLEVGGKDIIRRVTSTYAYLTASGSTGEYQLLPSASLTNAFYYNQNVGAAYLSYSASIGQAYSLRAGARYEYTTIAADFQTAQTFHLPSYGVLVPSLNLARKMANGNLLKASFNRRIQRPSLQYLNPNVQVANPLDVSQGNPLLRPEYTTNYELAYNSVFKGISVNISAFVRTTSGAIQGLSSVRGDTVYTTFANIGQAKVYGSNVFFTVRLSPKLTVNGSLDGYYSVLANNATDPRYQASNRGWVLNERLTASYAFAKNWSLQGFGFVRGRSVLLQGYEGPIITSSFDLRHRFWDQKASLSLGVDNVLPTNVRVPLSLSSPVLTQYTVDTRTMLAFRVSFSYHLGKLEALRPKKAVQNDDLKGN